MLYLKNMHALFYYFITTVLFNDCIDCIDLTKAYDFVDRTLFLTSTLARFGVPQNVISVIRQFHDGMQAFVRLDDRVCSGWNAVEQGSHRGCVLALAPLLLNIFFATVINVAYTHFKADKDIMNALVHIRIKMGAGGRGKSNSRRASSVISSSPEQLSG